MSLDMIETKLNNYQYENMTQLEQDLKRVVQNAKDFNDSKSEIFQDAERIRKALSNFMPKNNPAYEDPEYRAIPTPIPQHLLEKMRESSVSTNATGPDRVKLVLKKRPSMAPSTDGEGDSQEAMMALLEELSLEENAVNFEKKPPKRDYPDYYRLIDRATSISDVKILVKQGKIADWDSLAVEVRLIWENAKEYNEPGSAIFEMAEVLEDWFEEQVQAAGAGPKVKPQRLSLSQPKKTGIKLKVGASTPTPNIVGGAVDGESLRRQKEEMSQALNRVSRANSKPLLNGTPAPLSSAASLPRSLSSVEPSDVTMTGINGTVPAQQTYGSTTNQQLPAPLVNGLPPIMQAPTVNGHNQNNMAQGTRTLFTPPNNPLDRRWRDEGKGIPSQCSLFPNADII